VVVDEAHATGNLGPGGRGAVAEAGLEGEIDVVVGTLGKALGSYGAYVCANAEMVRYLINTARPLIYSTAPSPPAIAGALAALALLRERPHRVQRLRSNARVLRRALAAEGFPVADTEMQIVPLIVGDGHAAMCLCQEAIERGVFAQAIRPPTVATGSSRLRLTAMASHTASELEMAASVFGDAARAIGIEPASLAPALPERQEAADERELAYTELTAVASVRVDADDGSAATPFDLERDAHGPSVPAPALADPGAPLDGSGDRDADAPRVPVPALAEPNAPFDFERELHSVRAA
jgi:glycine C-acetyltransferase/8-amino-7-oxononanoate synthase